MFFLLHIGPSIENGRMLPVTHYARVQRASNPHVSILQPMHSFGYSNASDSKLCDVAITKLIPLNHHNRIVL